jgi:rsbT antagonist protein RsbS
MSTSNPTPRDIGRIPIIPLWGQLIVALQGDIDDRQAAILAEDVLRAIQRTGAKGMVVDISGLWLVDSHLCSVLLKLATSSRLMGTRTILTGMNPDVALTLQSMGIQFEGVETALGLEEGLDLLGLRVEGAAAHDAAHEELLHLTDSLLDGAAARATPSRPSRS